MIEAQRYRGAAAHLGERPAAEGSTGSGRRPRRRGCGAARSSTPRRSGSRPGSARAIGTLLRVPPQIDTRHLVSARVSVVERLGHLRRLLARGRFTFDEAVGRADRVTVAVTLFALLELYKQGEATWAQEVPFGDITIGGPAGEERTA